MSYSPNAQLSPNYVLKDLTVTNQNLTSPNIPDSDEYFNNLVQTANILEALDSDVGPFNIISGFRTPELQQVLIAQGEPATTKLSFHEIGRAVDIYPTNDSLDAFYGKLLANATLREQFAEIAYKPGQNSIHLAVNTPDDTRTPKIMGLNADKNYVSLTVDQIQDFIAPYVQDATEAAEAASEMVTSNPIPTTVIIGALGAAILYFMVLKKPKHA